MFNSGVSTKTLITDLQAEVDIASSIPGSAYATWLNSLEQLLYSELIKEMGTYEKSNTEGVFTMPLVVSDAQEPIRFEDVCGVYARATADSTDIFKGGGTTLTLTTPTSARTFDNVYYNLGGNLHFKTSVGPKITITYYVRPKQKSLTPTDAEKVMLPLEFLDLAKAKLRSEAYKLMNEDNLSAKWINDYNFLLETFKGWLDTRRPRFGV